MEKDMAGVSFSIKMVVVMMVNGNKIKCKGMVSFFINQINQHIKDTGLTICSKEKVDSTMKIQLRSSNHLITITSTRSMNIGNSMKVSIL